MAFFRGSLQFLLSATAFLISGCASNVALDHAVIAYDTTTANSISKQLLLNIARARHNQPMHFTAISNIAATYKFTVNAGVGGAVTGDRGSLLVPLFGSSAEENPTVSISPMQGDEFTQRLLTPFQEQRLTLLLRQGYDVDSLLRLMGAELRLQTEEPSKILVHNNRPSDRAGYTVFRQVVSHLSAIQEGSPCFVCRAAELPAHMDCASGGCNTRNIRDNLQGLFLNLHRGPARLPCVEKGKWSSYDHQL